MQQTNQHHNQTIGDIVGALKTTPQDDSSRIGSIKHKESLSKLTPGQTPGDQSSLFILGNESTFMGGNVTMLNKANTTQNNIIATEKLKNNLNILPEIHEEFVKNLE